MLAEQHADMVVLQAPAKVNLFLEILKKRSDGYHDIVTCMVAVDLFDTLTFKEEPSGEIRLCCVGQDSILSCPVGPENLVWRAAELLRRHTGVNCGVEIGLTKRIPVAAGLAGGSSDAAATLQGLNLLWNLNLPASELAELGSTLGSDVPFFFSIPAAWCTGRGEQVKPFPLKKRLHFVLACPAVGLATADVYQAVTVPTEPRSPEAVKQALDSGRVEAIGAELHNRLQPVAEAKCPEVTALRRLFETLAPAGHAMSGSGPSYFALARSRRDAQHLASQARQQLAPRAGTVMPPVEDLDQRLRLFVVRTLADGETLIRRKR